MESDDEFITRLMGFGLIEKEAQCYFYLLKYGPKTPSPLAKSLHTYREDVHRTLTALIEKGMVRPSLDSPTLYTAVELETALESALKKHESELREMERRKRELEELSRQQRFRPSDDVTTFKVIKSLKEFLAAVLPIALTLEKEWVTVCPENAVGVASIFGLTPQTKEFVDRGGRVRIIITDFSYSGIAPIRETLETGAEMRYIGEEGLIFTVFDRKIAMSGIHWELKSVSLNQPLTALFTDDPTYAQYLMATFEMMWKQATPVEERIEELLKQGPPQADA
ncbi:MAG: TrmB family transcriptional regulator [Halobacteriota archaeon]